jgi:L-fuconolactonase
MRIDSHQHFWRYSEEQYPWIKPEWSIRRDFLPAELEPLLTGSGLEGTVAVQARQSLEETRWLLELADQSPFIKGVVGWVDLRSSGVGRQLEQFSHHPKFVGVRHVVQDEPDDNFLLGGAFQSGIAELKPFGLTYDLLVFPRQLPAAIKLVEAFPDQPFVLDHLAKPPIKDRQLDPWQDQIRALAAFPNCSCKVSGLITEADWQNWKADDFKAFLDIVGEAFGIERLMYGSDWPVCLLAGEYQRVYDLAAGFAGRFSESDQAKFFGGNATKFYCLS